ncbi:MAG: IS481 family transposase, partial [Thermoplasmata archaeon]
MKLTPKKIRWIIKRKQEGMTSKEIAFAMKVSKRRVNQIWQIYRATGKIPEIGKRLGRPKKQPLSEREKEVIIMAKKKYKFGARRLEPLIKRDYGISIPHNTIHEFLLQQGLAQENVKK